MGEGGGSNAKIVYIPPKTVVRPKGEGGLLPLQIVGENRGTSGGERGGKKTKKWEKGPASPISNPTKGAHLPLSNEGGEGNSNNV